MKLCNVTASILLIIGGFYRLMASFGGPVVLPLCNKDAYRDRYCPGMADPDQCYRESCRNSQTNGQGLDGFSAFWQFHDKS
jgi:hypothetical protein